MIWGRLLDGVILLIFWSSLYSNNNCPIVLIHGFLGWGRDEMAGYYYWGGKMDFETRLRESGFEVYSVSVGPISPNWDRAIEAFYQIKGGQVDYGKEKAEKSGIIQRPSTKNYPGLYPRWSEENPIHIIAHSQGGQTARMLEMLLKKSYADEDSPLLINKYKGWIKSITTISTPHNGTTLVPIMLDIFPFALSLAPWFGGFENSTLNELYNFDLEQWGLERKKGESLNNYFKRLSQSSISNPKNLCTWDLSLEGANEFNLTYESDENVYYFSFSTSATDKEENLSTHKPDSKMSFHLWPTGQMMARYDGVLDSTWYENDGICNTISMTHPFIASLKQLNGEPERGVWQSVDKLHMDHQAVIGHHVTKKERDSLFVIYNNHCKLLYTLK